MSEPNFLPTSTVHFLGAIVPVNYFILTGIVVAAALALTIFLKYSMFGLQTRAAFENERAATWIGLSPNHLSLVNTLLASLVTGGLGILMASVATLDPVTLPLVVVPALTAALFANLTSVPIACAVGLAIGAMENILYYVTTLSWAPKSDGVPLPGVQSLLVFILMVIAVVLKGTKLPTRGDAVEKPLPIVPRPERILRPSMIALGLGAITLIVLPYDIRQAEITSFVFVALTASLIVITGYIGQISVMQLALSGVAGFVMSHLATDHGIGFPLNAVLGILVATLLGLGIGLAGLRVRGVQLALVSIAATVAIQNFWFGNAKWAAARPPRPIAEPKLFGLDIGGPTRTAHRRQPAEPGAGLRAPHRRGWALRVRGARAAHQARSADGGRALQRTRGGERGHRRSHRQARRVHVERVPGRRRRRDGGHQLRLGVSGPEQRAERPRRHLVRLHRRDHDGVGRGDRRPERRRCVLPTSVGTLHRAVGDARPAPGRHLPGVHARLLPERARGRDAPQEGIRQGGPAYESEFSRSALRRFIRSAVAKTRRTPRPLPLEERDEPV